MRNLKRMMLPAVAVAALTVLAACTPIESVDRADYQGPPLPQEIVERGTLVVTMDAEQAPGRFVDEDGELTGWEVELTEAIGEKLMIPVDFQITQFDSMLPGVKAGRYDFAVGSFDAIYFPERLAAHDFVTYFKSPGSTLLILAGNPSAIPEDQFCGFRVGAIRGSYDAALVEDEDARCREAGLEGIADGGTVYPSATATTMALKSDRIDAAMSDYAINAYQVSVSDGVFDAIGMYGDPGEYSIGFAKGASELTEAVRWAIQSLIDEGTYLEILEKWAVQDGAIETSEIITEAP